MIGILFGVLEWFRQCNNNDHLLRTHGSCRGWLIIPIRGGEGKDGLFRYFIHTGHHSYHFFWITLKVALITCSYLSFFGEGRLHKGGNFFPTSPRPHHIQELQLSGGGDGSSSPSLTFAAPLSLVITTPQSFQLYTTPPLLPPCLLFFGGSVRCCQKREKDGKRASSHKLQTRIKIKNIVTMSKSLLVLA